MNLKDLAASLGLSQTTVSRALNGYPEVSEATRKRVAEAARRHGYRPDSRARSLATGKAMAVGLVLPMTAKQEIVNPVFADFVAGACETLASRGYDIVMSLANDEEQTTVYRSMLAKGRVDGMIMQAPLTGDKRIALLKELGAIWKSLHSRFEPMIDTFLHIDTPGLIAAVFGAVTTSASKIGYKSHCQNAVISHAPVHLVWL